MRRLAAPCVSGVQGLVVLDVMRYGQQFPRSLGGRWEGHVIRQATIEGEFTLEAGAYSFLRHKRNVAAGHA